MEGLVIHAPHDLRVDSVPLEHPGAGQVQVEVRCGGICGSDLHYYHHGGFGKVRLSGPMVLGHEFSGVVAALGKGVSGLAPGDRVVINPSLPCGECRYCRRGLRNHCLDMRFMGSAMRVPPVQGGFRERVVVQAVQVIPIADGLGFETAAAAEPLAVCLHALAQAGPVAGRRVLVTGCGPIGLLLIAVARHAGAGEIVATDIQSFPLGLARRMGADRVINVATNLDALSDAAPDQERFDILFEASGSANALAACLPVMRPRGRVVQVGLGGQMAIPMDLVVARELSFFGSFRFDAEFAQGLVLLGEGAIDVSPMFTHRFAMHDAIEAFETASDRRRAGKVLIKFGAA